MTCCSFLPFHCQSNHEHLFLQSEECLYLNTGDMVSETTDVFRPTSGNPNLPEETWPSPGADRSMGHSTLVSNKQWLVVQVRFRAWWRHLTYFPLPWSRCHFIFTDISRHDSLLSRFWFSPNIAYFYFSRPFRLLSKPRPFLYFDHVLSVSTLTCVYFFLADLAYVFREQLAGQSESRLLLTILFHFMSGKCVLMYGDVYTYVLHMFVGVCTVLFWAHIEILLTKSWKVTL